MPSRSIYVSSKLKHRDMWLSWRMPIVSSWIHGIEPSRHEYSAMWDKYRDEVEMCDAFVLYLEPGDQPKGCMVELALAFGLRRSIVIIWAGSLDDLAAKMGTIVHHESVTIVESINDARNLLADDQ